MKNYEKIKLSFNNFFVNIFGKGFKTVASRNNSTH